MQRQANTLRKIGLISYALDRNPSGIGQYTLHLLQALRSDGNSPTILQSGGWPAGFHPDGCRIIPLPGSRLLPALLSLGQLQIGWQTRRLDLKLVHDPTGTIPLGLCPVKGVATICDAIPYVYPGVSTALDRIIYRHWLPFAVKQVDGVITISQHSKTDLENHLKIPKNKIIVTPLAASPKFRLLSETEIMPVLERVGLKHPYILYVGSVEPRKNLIRLLEAYALLREWCPKWRLVIVGTRNYWKSSPVAQAVQAKGLQGSVAFTGYVRDEDLPALYNGTDLFCFPSLYEGFGLPVMEAMACGAPVVTSNTSSLPEVAGEAAILVDPYNVEEIADAMRRVLEDPELALELRERGLAHTTQFTWEKTARQTIAVYEEVLGEKLL